MVSRLHSILQMALVEIKFYNKYVITYKYGQVMMYMKTKNSLFGLLRSALLFYRKLLAYLDKYGI